MLYRLLMSGVWGLNKLYMTPKGSITYAELDPDRRYDYADEKDPIWDQAQLWFELTNIRVHKKFQGDGKRLLQSFLFILPKKAGVVLNSLSLDDDIPFETLQNWYKKQGFKEIATGNVSLFLIKESF